MLFYFNIIMKYYFLLLSSITLPFNYIQNVRITDYLLMTDGLIN